MASSRASVLAIIGFVLLLRVPFLGEAVQGDDLYYLAGAQHAQIDPLHPHGARYAFQGVLVDMRGHPHPPLNAWILAGLLAAAGDIRERVFHAAYIVFSLIAALSMWSLAKRFSPRPLAATLLFLATIAFVVNGTSLEADVPFLAFWMAGLALFVRAVDSGSVLALAGTGAAIALAALTAFQSILLLPILAAYLLLRRCRWPAAWAVLAVPVVVLLGWQIYERVTSGALPAAVLAGYVQSYGLQQWTAKLKNAAALTAHAGWLLFPPLAVAAFFRLPRRAALLIAAGMAALAVVDPNPLFWASWGVGALVLVHCLTRLRKGSDADERFLASWVILFFTAALVLFFAGAARYLLPMAAPVALLASRRLANHRAWLAGGVAAELVVSLALAAANYQHWNGYRRFVQGLRPQTAQALTWINGDWGMRFYAEAEGALPLMRDTQLRPGDLVLTSKLGGFSEAARGPRVLLAAQEIHPWIPLRLVGAESRTGYSSVAYGLRPFGVSAAPVDRVQAEMVGERRPSLSYLPMNSPEAENQIVSGLSHLEDKAWRWTAQRAIVVLKSPERPLPLEASIFVPDAAQARRVELLIDGSPVAEASWPNPGAYTVQSKPLKPSSPSVTVVLLVDRTFRAPGDQRDLGVVLRAIGFRE